VYLVDKEVACAASLSNQKKDMYAKQAITLLHDCITPKGFTASPTDKDNYKRVWSRDAMIAGIGALLSDDQEGIDALRTSVLTLAKYQSKTGQIPSNVSLDEQNVSYGSLAGRVDATTWWIIGACWIVKKDHHLLEELNSKILRAFRLLEYWEMNGRGFVYTPLGGNWADEYISQGYVLYDQVLRLWALKAYANVADHDGMRKCAQKLERLVDLNYSFCHPVSTELYHPLAYERAFETMDFWAMSFSPAGYDKRWDMAANALVLLLGLNKNVPRTEAFLEMIIAQNGNAMLPVFYPVIEENDAEWKLLQNNFLFQFKNVPNHFHNGGSWPVFLGLLSLGFAANGAMKIPNAILQEMNERIVQNEHSVSFTEYWNPKSLKPGGVPKLGFSASGYLMMVAAKWRAEELKSILLC
jgi:Alkaline and neutral invertase